MLANSVGFKVKLAKGSKCYHSKGEGGVKQEFQEEKTKMKNQWTGISQLSSGYQLEG